MVVPEGPEHQVCPGPSAFPEVRPRRTLGIVSIVAGLASIVLSWIPAFGALVGVVAIVLGVMGRGHEPGTPRWVLTVGIMAGVVGIALGLISFIVLVVLPLRFS